MYDYITFTTGLLKFLKLLRFSRIVRPVGNCKDEVFRKNKWNPFSVDPKLFLVMAKEMTKVNVENLTFLIDHDVVWMPEK